MYHKAEIERLRHIEFNSRLEISLRFIAIGLAGLAGYFYTERVIVLLWMAGYFALHLIYWKVLNTRKEPYNDRDLAVVSAVYLAVLFTFASLPVYLTADDHVALSFGGTAACTCLAIYLIWRADTLPFLIYGEITVMAVAIGVVTVVFATHVPVAGHRAVMVGCGAVVWGYFVLALMTARIRVIRLAQSAQRAAQARKMEAVGRLAGGVAHDFNNILTALQGNLELYREVSDPAERDRLVSEAYRASKRAAELTQNLLSYARNAPLRSARVPVSRILEQASQLSRAMMPRDVALHIKAPLDEIMVAVDESQLMTALVNLISNACDAMESQGALELGAREVVLSDRRQLIDGAMLEPGRYLAIWVADTGHGIPPELLKRVADPFFSTKPVDKGTGLGLSTVSGFAIQSGGGLNVESAQTGTRATIYLPWPLEGVAQPAPARTETAHETMKAQSR